MIHNNVTASTGPTIDEIINILACRAGPSQQGRPHQNGVSPWGMTAYSGNMADCTCPSTCGKGKLKPACKSLFSKLLSVALEYDTVKHVHVRNLKIGLIFRTIQFLVLVFIGV